MISILFGIWRARWFIAFGLLTIFMVGTWLYIRALQAEAESARANAIAIQAAHKETLATLDSLIQVRNKENAIASKIDAAQRNRTEKVRLVTKTILSKEPAELCPISEAIDAAIDGDIQ